MDRSDTNTFGVCALKLQAVMINFKMFYVHNWYTMRRNILNSCNLVSISKKKKVLHIWGGIY